MMKEKFVKVTFDGDDTVLEIKNLDMVESLAAMNAILVGLSSESNIPVKHLLTLFTMGVLGIEEDE